MHGCTRGRRNIIIALFTRRTLTVSGNTRPMRSGARAADDGRTALERTVFFLFPGEWTALFFSPIAYCPVPAKASEYLLFVQFFFILSFFRRVFSTFFDFRGGNPSEDATRPFPSPRANSRDGPRTDNKSDHCRNLRSVRDRWRKYITTVQPNKRKHCLPNLRLRRICSGSLQRSHIG